MMHCLGDNAKDVLHSTIKGRQEEVAIYMARVLKSSTNFSGVEGIVIERA